MIWFFLAGFISGAVGILLFADSWFERHIGRVYFPEDEDETEHKDEDDSGDPEEREVSEQD